jgi:predicted nucleotidyltransferase
MTMQLDTAALKKELIAGGRLPATVTALFVGGSYARGWANDQSDIDLYVVTAQPWTSPEAITAPVGLNPACITMELWEFAGVRCDIEYWLDKQVDQLIGSVSWEAFDNVDAVTAKMTVEELYLLERLPSATVIDGPDWVAERRQRIRASAYQRVLLARAFNNADGFAEDAIGQLRDGDLESATLSARVAFHHAVDGVLISHGEYGRSPKWRARRFHAADPHELSFDEYWNVETMRTYDPAAPGQWISDVIRLCRRVMTQVSVV